LETMNLFLQTKFLSGILNVFLNISLCLLAVTSGYLLTKLF
jgi:fluoride ion exporter CrcB/FEX